MKCLQKEKENSVESSQKEEIENYVAQLKLQNVLHKNKAETFYTRKRIVTNECKRDVHIESICISFGCNLPIPNVSTNDVYCKR